MLPRAKYDPVSVYTSCAISDSVFSGGSSTASTIIIIHVIKNSTCGCIATLFIGLPKFFPLTSPKFITFET